MQPRRKSSPLPSVGPSRPRALSAATTRSSLPVAASLLLLLSSTACTREANDESAIGADDRALSSTHHPGTNVTSPDPTGATPTPPTTPPIGAATTIETTPSPLSTWLRTTLTPPPPPPPIPSTPHMAGAVAYVAPTVATAPPPRPPPVGGKVAPVRPKTPPKPAMIK